MFIDLSHLYQISTFYNLTCDEVGRVGSRYDAKMLLGASNIFEDFRAQPAFTHRWYEHSHQQSGCTAALRLKTHVGMTPRPLSQQEQNQKTEVARIAPRISLLPAKLRFRVQVASYTLTSRTSKMSWGALFSGRPPDVTWLQIIFKMAVSGAYKDLRASVALTKFFLWGHRADLGFVACQNLFKALTCWKSQRQDFQWNLNSPMLKALKMSLTRLQCQVADNGIVSWPLGSWDPAFPPAFCDRFAHNFRVHWRFVQLNQCFFDRNDALFAGSSVIERLHSQSQRASGDEIAIMTGGLLTHSSLCDHLLWHCPYFRDIRSLPQSYDPVVTRLGWNQDIQLPILAQMAKI